jgi:hypothetical protein
MHKLYKIELTIEASNKEEARENACLTLNDNRVHIDSLMIKEVETYK